MEWPVGGAASPPPKKWLRVKCLEILNTLFEKVGYSGFKNTKFMVIEIHFCRYSQI